MIFTLITKFAIDCGADPTFFGLPTWYKYLQLEADNQGGCRVIIDLAQRPADVWLIALGVADILIRLAGMVAIGFVIYGGFRYMTSQGEPDKTAAAKDTILNSLIGLVVAVLATSIVGFIGSQFGGARNEATSLPGTPPGNPLQTAMQIIFGLLGVIAVIVIVVAGFQYVTSQGEPQKTAKARNTIIYALVGLVVAVSAYAIVGFVLERV